jgi:hypothetical protein
MGHLQSEQVQACPAFWKLDFPGLRPDPAEVFPDFARIGFPDSRYLQVPDRLKAFLENRPEDF